jgi:diguanylate cyclase (GGDEF)-like protein
MVDAKSRNYIIDMKTGFYNRRFFKIRLREEQRRTERSSSPFSLLTLDISDLADLIEKQPKLKIHQMKKVITNIVRENTRDIDIKNWHDDTTLKILMPQTPKSGAIILAEKLQEKVNDALKTFFGLKRAFDLKGNMIIKSYPEAMKNPEEPSGSKPPVTKKPMASAPVRWGNKKINRPNKEMRGHKK